MSVEDLITDPPKIHGPGIGVACLSLEGWALRRIHDIVDSDMTTMETGAGLSTIVFAQKSRRHFCITPAAEEVQRLEKYASEHKIPFDTVEFCIGKSEEVLPEFRGVSIDVGLIDGRHGFPAPIIDWYYMANLLKVNGWLIVDDIELWPVRHLTDFLGHSSDWRIDCVRGKTAFYRYLGGDSHNLEWDAQPYVVQESRPAPMAVWKRRLREYSLLVSRCDWQELRSRLKRVGR